MHLLFVIHCFPDPPSLVQQPVLPSSISDWVFTSHQRHPSLVHRLLLSVIHPHLSSLVLYSFSDSLSFCHPLADVLWVIHPRFLRVSYSTFIIHRVANSGFLLIFEQSVLLSSIGRHPFGLLHPRVYSTSIPQSFRSPSHHPSASLQYVHPTVRPSVIHWPMSFGSPFRHPSVSSFGLQYGYPMLPSITQLVLSIIISFLVIHWQLSRSSTPIFFFGSSPRHLFTVHHIIHTILSPSIITVPRIIHLFYQCEIPFLYQLLSRTSSPSTIIFALPFFIDNSEFAKPSHPNLQCSLNLSLTSA